LLAFVRSGSVDIGDVGRLLIYEFNGKEYNVAREINHEVSLAKSKKYMIKYIIHWSYEEHPYDIYNEEKNKLIWKSKDDDKYRKIK
jgi:hypothetical protein